MLLLLLLHEPWVTHQDPAEPCRSRQPGNCFHMGPFPLQLSGSPLMQEGRIQALQLAEETKHVLGSNSYWNAIWKGSCYTRWAAVLCAISCSFSPLLLPHLTSPFHDPKLHLNQTHPCYTRQAILCDADKTQVLFHPEEIPK